MTDICPQCRQVVTNLGPSYVFRGYVYHDSCTDDIRQAVQAIPVPIPIPDDIVKAPPVAESKVMWRCRDGHLSFMHYEHCSICGAEKPQQLKAS